MLSVVRLIGVIPSVGAPMEHLSLTVGGSINKETIVDRGRKEEE
jgi:hypothetical protein